MKRMLSLIFMLLSPGILQAAVCSAKIHRECKPGKPCRVTETRSFTSNSEDNCLSEAKALCHVYFSDGVAQKKVTASFEGKNLQGGQDLCHPH